MDEMWSFVGSKSQQRWLWHAIDHHTGQIFAYIFGTRGDETFLQLKALLAPFGITHFYTDGWGASRRHLDPSTHTVGKQQTQKIEALVGFQGRGICRCRTTQLLSPFPP